MTDKEKIAALVLKYGVDGVIGLVALFLEDQADEKANTLTGPLYNRASLKCWQLSQEIKEMLR